MDDVRKLRLSTGLKWALGLVGAVVISPVVFLAVKGLVGLALAAVVGVTIIQFAPVVSLKLANWKLRALTAEVEANPIETMQNLYIEKSKELAAADQNIIDFETEIGNFDDEVRGFKKEYPDEAPRYQQISDAMHTGLTEMKSEQEFARDRLEDFQARIRKAQAIYKMSLAASRVTAFSKSAEARVFQDIKEQIAFDSVRTELNRSFASLSNALSKRTERPLLTKAAV